MSVTTKGCADIAAAQQLLKSVIQQISANLSMPISEEEQTKLKGDLKVAQKNLSDLNDTIYQWAVQAIINSKNI